MLESDQTYTFKIIDNDHPYGVEVEIHTWLDGDVIRWEGETRGELFGTTCVYTIEYTGTVNRISSVRGSKESDWLPNYPVSFYTAESVHTIDKRYVDIPKEVPSPTSDAAGQALGVVLNSFTRQPEYGFISVGTQLPEPTQYNNGYVLQVKYINGQYKYALESRSPITYYYDSTRVKPNVYKNAAFTSVLSYSDATNMRTQFNAGIPILLRDGNSDDVFTVSSVYYRTSGYTTIYAGAVVKKVVDNTTSYEFINFYVADND